MTILQPNKNKFHLDSTFVLLIGAAILAAVLNIYLYSNIVSLRHGLLDNIDALQKSQAANAEFKNGLYKILGFDNLKKVASELALVKEARPIYLEAGVSVAASHLPQP